MDPLISITNRAGLYIFKGLNSTESYFAVWFCILTNMEMFEYNKIMKEQFNGKEYYFNKFHKYLII
jgi:hypothetical protein